MATYAVVSSQDNTVINVIKLSDDDICDHETGEDCPHKVCCKKDEIYGHDCDHKFIKTSFNRNLLGKYAAVGDIYLEDIEMFVEPKPYDHFILDKQNGIWIPSEPKPTRTQYQIDNMIDYGWNEQLYQSGESGWLLCCFPGDINPPLQNPLGEDGEPLDGSYFWNSEKYIEGDVLSGFVFIENNLPEDPVELVEPSQE
jgi:hypothetical protein